MSEFFFISYSSVDGKEFAMKLADELAAGPPTIVVWLDKRAIRPGEDWDEQVAEAIKTCKGMLFIMSADSVRPDSVCKNEWVRALKYKKPVIPLLLNRDAELPFRLGSRQYINFSGPFETGLAQLRKHLAWVDSPEGLLQALKHRLSDAQRELPRAAADQQARIQEDIAELERQIAQQQAIMANPQAAEERVQRTIDRGLERMREPATPVSGITHSKFINPPPLVAPTWFQDRHVETKLIGDFLKDDALRLVTVVGRGGIGKSAMVCRLLRSLESGQLPDDGGALAVDGIVYLSDARARSEEQKTACQPKPTAPLALSSSERRDPAHFAPLRPLRRPSRPKQHRDFHQTERRLTTPRAGDKAPIRKKGCLNFLYVCEAVVCERRRHRDDPRGKGCVQIAPSPRLFHGARLARRRERFEGTRMDFLKYLDVIIGLSVVMVLLSPLVTAVTQAVMWFGNSRSSFLEQALLRLIVQLEGHLSAIVSLRTPSGAVAGKSITTRDGKTFLGEPVPGAQPTTNTAGELWCPDGIPFSAVTRGNIVLKTEPGSVLSIRRIPQASPDPFTVVSATTDAVGKARLKYVFEGPSPAASTSATLIVKDANGAQIAASVACTIEGSAVTVAAPARGESAAVTRPDPPPPSTASTAGTTAQPAAGTGTSAGSPTASTLTRSGSFDIECTVSGPASVGDLTIEAHFPRVDRFDRTLGPVTADANGIITITSSALQVTDAIVRHPMVARIPLPGRWPKIPPVKNRTAEVVEREELIRILLELAAGEGSGSAHLGASQRQALQRLLALNDIHSPSDALAAIRKASQELENTNPQLALHVRHAMAIVRAAESAFVGKINHWFDAAMARASQQYAAKARAITVVSALMVALALQFNSLDLLRRLSADPSFRNSLVEMAKAEQARIDAETAKAEGSTGANDAEGKNKAGEAKNVEDTEQTQKVKEADQVFRGARQQEIDANLAALRAPELDILPDHLVWQTVPRARLLRNPSWKTFPPRLELLAGRRSWDVRPVWSKDPLVDIKAAIEKTGAPVITAIEPASADRPGDALVITATRLGDLELRHTPGKADTNIFNAQQERTWLLLTRLRNGIGPDLLGVLLSWALLSLGAPFWFDALKNALKLRPAAAATEQKNREERQKKN